MRKKLKFVLPLAVIGIGLIGAMVLVKARPEVETTPFTVEPPLVRVQELRPQTVELTVQSQGSVTPKIESTLSAQVSGKIIKTSEAFADGGFFEAGDELLRIDDRDYRFAVTRAEAQVAQARLRLALEQEEAEIARQEWQELGQGEAGPLVTREYQLQEAAASLAAAEAALEQARLDLERTRIVASFAGRVRRKSVDLGQYVNRGTPLAQVYSVEIAEVRLPVRNDDLAFLELPFEFRGEELTENGPPVTLISDFGGAEQRWQGRIVRVDGEIDPKTRMLHLIAQVENPYGRGAKAGRPPLTVGLFVDAEIKGKTVDEVFVIPRAALRGERNVLVIDSEDRLRFRQVEILRAKTEEVIIDSGLAAGERVCLSPLDTVVDGMKVKTVVDSKAEELASRQEEAE